MRIAFCYEKVLPARGGCATYIADLARRMVSDAHEVHLYTCRWDPAALPQALHVHELAPPRGPRWLRPWRFGAACEEALRQARHDVSLGFDKTWGQDVLYPQGGLHAASAEHNLHKVAHPIGRSLARLAKKLDLAHHSYLALERRQYLGPERPLIVVNSEMVRRHFQHYYGINPAEVRVLYSAIDPNRFVEQDRPRRRLKWREQFGIGSHETVALFAAMNYRLKGLEPLLHALKLLPADPALRLVVAGDPNTVRYEALARRLGVAARVCFAGHCNSMRDAYFAADFLVHPTFYDPCSLVVLEALACGLPVITTRANGASELLKPPREGLVIDSAHNHEQLAWSLSQLLDPARRSACSQAARRAAAQWTFEHHYRQLMHVLMEAQARKQAA